MRISRIAPKNSKKERKQFFLGALRVFAVQFY